MKMRAVAKVGVVLLASCTVYEQPPNTPPPAAAPPRPVAAAPAPAPAPRAPAPAPAPANGGSIGGAVGASGPLGSAGASGNISWGNWSSTSGEAAPAATCVKESNKELCFDAVDNNCDGRIDEGCSYQTGTLQFVIAWKLAVDLDLHVAGPDGKEIYWKERGSAGLMLDKDCHGLKDGVDDCPNGKVENIYFPDGRSVSKGRYKVWVNVFDSRGVKDAVVPFVFGARVGVKTFAVPFVLTNQKGQQKQFAFDVI